MTANPIDLARAVPAKVRLWVYTVVATLVLAESVFDFLHGEVERWAEKVITFLSMIGLYGAAANVELPPKPPEDPALLVPAPDAP